MSPLSEGLRADDGVIVVDHGSRVEQSNQALERIAKSFQSTIEHTIVEPAHMELAHPSIQDAVDLCVSQGARRIVMVPFFLLPGRHWKQDIPQLTAEACEKHGVPFLVTAPLGEAQGVIDVLVGRMEHCLQQVQQQGDCDACRHGKTCWALSDSQQSSE